MFLTTSVVQPHPITCDPATSRTVTSTQASPNSDEWEADLLEEASGSSLAFAYWDTTQKTSRAIVGNVLLRNFWMNKLNDLMKLMKWNFFNASFLLRRIEWKMK